MADYLADFVGVISMADKLIGAFFLFLLSVEGVRFGFRVAQGR